MLRSGIWYLCFSVNHYFYHRKSWKLYHRRVLTHFGGWTHQLNIRIDSIMKSNFCFLQVVVILFDFRKIFCCFPIELSVLFSNKPEIEFKLHSERPETCCCPLLQKTFRQFHIYLRDHKSQHKFLVVKERVLFAPFSSFEI